MAHPVGPATKLQITYAELAQPKACLCVRKAPAHEKLRCRALS